METVFLILAFLLNAVLLVVLIVFMLQLKNAVTPIANLLHF
jgi:hypothetical protein